MSSIIFAKFDGADILQNTCQNLQKQNWMKRSYTVFYKEMILQNPKTLRKCYDNFPVTIFKKADFSWSFLKVTKLCKFY